MRRDAISVAIGLLLMGAIALGCSSETEPEPVTPTAATTETATASASPSTPTALPTSSVEEQVSEAYLAYWEAYADALLNLDASLADQRTRGEERARIGGEIEELRTEGVALRVVIQHDFGITELGADSARIVDRYLDSSFSVDPATKLPETAEVPGVLIIDSFELARLESGEWIVVSSRRIE